MLNRYRENADKQVQDGKGPLRLFGVGLMLSRAAVRGVGKGRVCAVPPFNSPDAMVGTLRFAHPTKLRHPARQPYHFQQHRFAGIDQLFQRDARKTLAPERAAARQRRDVDEGGEARAVVGIDGLDRTPA